MSSFTYMTSRAATLGVQTTSDFGNTEIRSQETFGLPVGISFRIPTDLTGKVHWEEMPNATVDPKTGKKRKTPYLILKVEGMKDDDENSGIRFYPSTLTKIAFEAEKDGTLTGNIIRAKGTAVDLYKNYHRMQDGMKELAGKLLKVEGMTEVRVRRFGSTTETRQSNVPTINIVEEKEVEEK